MIVAVKWAREHKIPFFGICLGLQVAVIEWARNVCGMTGANSTELEADTPHPAVIFMPEISKTHLGGTMRLGLRPTIFDQGTEQSTIRQLYGGEETVWERHRHRYEVNPKLVPEFEKGTDKGGEKLRFIGKDERRERMQIIEMEGAFLLTFPLHRFWPAWKADFLESTFALTTGHPYFVALQAHPEFCSRPLNPSPPFLGFIAAAAGQQCLAEQVARNLKEYTAPHPESDKVVKSSEESRDGEVEKATQQRVEEANSGSAAKVNGQ